MISSELWCIIVNVYMGLFKKDFMVFGMIRAVKIAVFLLLGLAMPSVSFAMVEKPLEDYSHELSYEEFYADSIDHYEKAYNDKALEFKIRLPKDWDMIKDMEESGTSGWAGYDPGWGGEEEVVPTFDQKKDYLGLKADEEKRRTLTEDDSLSEVTDIVAEFVGRGRLKAERARVEVFSERLKAGLNPKAWLVSYVYVNNFNLIGIERKSENRADGLYLEYKHGKTYIVRMAVVSNGSRMYLVKYTIESSLFNKERAKQQHVIDSFEFLAPQEEVTPPSKQFAYLDKMLYNYPKSWVMNSPRVNGIESFDVEFIDNADQSLATSQIKLSFVSRTIPVDFEKEIQLFDLALKKKGLRIGDMIETIDTYKLDESAVYSQVHVYEAVPTNDVYEKHEFMVAVIVYERYYAFVRLLVPPRGGDFYSWMMSSAALEFICESIRPDRGETKNAIDDFDSLGANR